MKMLCPFRIKTVLTEKDGKKFQKEEYPECHGDACPFYDSSYNRDRMDFGTCTKIRFNRGVSK